MYKFIENCALCPVSSTMPWACCIISGRTTALQSPRCSTSSPNLVSSLPSPIACSSGSQANCWMRRREGEQSCSNLLQRHTMTSGHLQIADAVDFCLVSSQSWQSLVWLHWELPEEQKWDGGVWGCLCHCPYAKLHCQGAGPCCVWSVLTPHTFLICLCFSPKE